MFLFSDIDFDNILLYHMFLVPYNHSQQLCPRKTIPPMPHNLSVFSFPFSPPLARHYNSALSIWLSVDPMSDKYPSTSPYTYCGNNPVRLVDPNGEDIITIYADGSYSIKQKKGRDVLKSPETFQRQRLSANGIFKEAVSQKTAELNGNQKPKETLFSGLERHDAQSIFCFLGDNTQVEWGYLEQENQDGSNSYCVGSSHDFEKETFISQMIYDADKVIRYDHSHPVQNYNDVDAQRYSKEDIGFWNDLIERHPNATAGIRCGSSTKIYYRQGKQTDAYFDKKNRPLR